MRHQAESLTEGVVGFQNFENPKHIAIKKQMYPLFNNRKGIKKGEIGKKGGETGKRRVRAS
jgi:hypothetical protein